MNWQDELATLELAKNWDSAIALLQNTMEVNTASLEHYLAFNYLLMNLLVEEDYDQKKHDEYAELLKENYLESFSIFGSTPQFLFYTGITAHIAEWYFDINIEQAKQMLKQCVEMEPGNVLFQWGVTTYLKMNNNEAKYASKNLAQQVLLTQKIIADLSNKGALGKYVMEKLEYSANRIVEM